MKKITCKKVRELIKDEDMATKEYKKYGFNNLSRSEKGHKTFLESVLKKRCR